MRLVVISSGTLVILCKFEIMLAMSTREAEFLKVRVLFSFLQVEYDDTGNVYSVSRAGQPY